MYCVLIFFLVAISATCGYAPYKLCGKHLAVKYTIPRTLKGYDAITVIASPDEDFYGKNIKDNTMCISLRGQPDLAEEAEPSYLLIMNLDTNAMSDKMNIPNSTVSKISEIVTNIGENDLPDKIVKFTITIDENFTAFANSTHENGGPKKFSSAKVNELGTLNELIINGNIAAIKKVDISVVGDKINNVGPDIEISCN